MNLPMNISPNCINLHQYLHVKTSEVLFLIFFAPPERLEPVKKAWDPARAAMSSTLIETSSLLGGSEDGESTCSPTANPTYSNGKSPIEFHDLATFPTVMFHGYVRG